MEYIYGALLLHKLGHPVNEDNLKKVIHATGSQVDESKLKALIWKGLHGVDIGAELENANVAVAAPSAGASAAPAKEEKKEKPSESAGGLLVSSVNLI